jgi:serine/threonine-protein kinase RsbT
MVSPEKINNLLKKVPELLKKNINYASQIWFIQSKIDLSSITLIYSNNEAQSLLQSNIPNHTDLKIRTNFPYLLQTEIPSTILKVVLSNSPQYIYSINYPYTGIPELKLFFKIYPIDKHHAISFFKKIDFQTNSNSSSINITNSLDILLLIKMIKENAIHILMATLKIMQLVVACTELGRNLLIHGFGGIVTISKLFLENGQVGIKVEFNDSGPGISNIDKAMTDGYSSIGTLGIGLGVAKRAVDDFKINSSTTGTYIQIISWRSDYLKNF